MSLSFILGRIKKIIANAWESIEKFNVCHYFLDLNYF